MGGGAEGGGVSIPTLYVNSWWPLFLAMKFSFLYLNLAKILNFIPKCTKGGGEGATNGLGNITKKNF